MLEPERGTVTTLVLEPWLFVVGVLVGVAWLASVAIAAGVIALVQIRWHPDAALLWPLAGLPSVLLLPPALSSLYAVVREHRERDERLGLVVTLTVAVEGAIKHAGELTSATIRYRVVALGPAAVAFALLLAGDTAVDYWRYAQGATVTPRWGFEWVLFVGYVVLAGAVGRLVFVFYDMAVVFARVPPRRGWRMASRFARRRPGTLLRYGAVRTLLWSPMLFVPFVAFQLLAGGSVPWLPSSRLQVAAGALAVGTVVGTVVSTYHVLAYEHLAKPVLAEPRRTTTTPTDGPRSPLVEDAGVNDQDQDESTGGRGRRIAVTVLAVLLVTAGAAGTVAVRVDDTRPTPDATKPVDDSMDGEAVLSNAHRTGAAASFHKRTVEYRTNGSAEPDDAFIFEARVDRDTRRVRWSAKMDENTHQFYVTEGVFATDADSVPAPSRYRVAQTRRGPWTISTVPGYGQVGDRFAVDLPETHGWDVRVLERTDDRVVVGDTRRPDEEAPDDGEQVTVERMRVTVDPDTGQPTSFVVNRTVVEYENDSAVDRYYLVQEGEFTYGDPGVERPGGIGRPGPLEWFWDLVYY